MCARARFARSAPSRVRARPPLPFRLRASSSSLCFRKTYDFGFGIGTARTASAGRGGRARGILSGHVGDELVEVRVGEPAPDALAATATAHVAKRAVGDVLAQQFDGNAELGGRLGLD